MANKRISALPVATSTVVGDVVAVDGTTTRSITVENFLTPNLDAIKGLTSAADKGIQFTGVGTAAVYDLTAAGKALLDDADAAAQRTTLGLVIGTNVQAYDADLTALSAVSTDGQLPVGQTAGVPIWKTITGDFTITAAGATAIGATKVTSAMLNADVYSTAHTWAGQQTFVAPALGTIASGVATNLTGTASGLTAGNVTTNANLTGDVTSVGNAATIAANAVTNAKAAQMAAYTIKGNATGLTADATDISIPALTMKASPVAGDIVLISDSAASNALKYTTVSALASAGSVASIGGLTGAVGVANGLEASGSDIQISAARRTLPTITLLTTGAAATYAAPANALWIRVRMVGGGGGGASATAAASQTNVGAGGGGGGYVEHIITSPSGNYTYTVSSSGGAAGSAGTSTTFSGTGATLSAGGGSGTGSTTGSGTTLARTSAPGDGGVVSGGNVLNIPGSSGDYGLRYSGTEAISANGGDSYLGFGGIRVAVGNGTAGSGYGGGGGGASSIDTTARTGGAGSPGIIIIEEYYN
jgi:hypothetical protein